MKGFVPTPQATVDLMVERLFQDRPPRRGDKVLDPGCGTGEFIDGVLRWCNRHRKPVPQITGVELNPRHVAVSRAKYEGLKSVKIEQADFLIDGRGKFEFILGNPPYVGITGLSASEKARYRSCYVTARGRFDLYLLFFEQALRNLATGGRLVFITPEKFLYVETAAPLRALLARHHVEEIRLMPEDTFGELVTYPTITVVSNTPSRTTHFVRRDEGRITANVQARGEPWMHLFEGTTTRSSLATLGDLCARISCGVATGADGVFVRRAMDLDPLLQRFSYPTIAGRQLTGESQELPRRSVMLIPYGLDSDLLPMERLGAFGKYLMRADIRARLLARTCVQRKPWYAFHETPALSEVLHPKILWKDICERPQFWVDKSGDIVPRHSVYYLVPREPAALDVILDYLKSPSACQWLTQNCQRASKGFLRLQSRVLRRMPVPDEVVAGVMGNSRATRREPSPRQMELAFAE